MSSYYKHKILSKQRIFLQYFKGIVNFNTIVIVMNKVMSDKSFDPSFNSIVDFRDAHIDFDEIEVERFVDILNKQNALNKYRRAALLTNTPNQVVFLSMYTSLTEKNIVNYKIFSTIESSLQWIEINKESETFIRKELENLRKSPEQILI